MEDYQFINDDCTPENELVMESLITGKEAQLMELLKKHQEEIDVHKLCRNGTTIACAAVKTRNIDIFKTILGDQRNCGGQRNSKRLRTSDCSVEFPMRDLSNFACQHRSSLERGTNQEFRMGTYFDPIGRISQLDNYGKNVLHYAVSLNELEMVEYLIRKFRDLSCNQFDRSMNSPLHLAVIRESREMVKLLLSLGATVDLKDNEGKTPLHIAAERGSTEMIETLLEAKSDINALDFTGQSTLMLATLYNNCEAVELLVKRGAKVNYEDDRGFTALKRAVFVKNSKVTRILVENGARICESMKLLHLAAVYNQLDIAKSLLDGGARLESRDNKGYTPLMRAIEYSNYEMTEFLLMRGADPNFPNSLSESTSLHLCIFHIKDKNVIGPFIDLLLKYGADVSLGCRYAFDALYYSFKFRNDAAAIHLIRTGMDVNHKHKLCTMDYLSSCLFHSEGSAPIQWIMLSGFKMENYVDGPLNLEKELNPKKRSLHEWLRSMKSLKDLCRMNLRRLVNHNDIPKLPLPQALHKFLRLEVP